MFLTRVRKITLKVNVPLPIPTTLGLKKSFGFGDRLGLAGPGHLASALKSDFAGIFAQQSIRELDRTARTPDEVMRAAQSAIAAIDYSQPWGADADHLKTDDDVRLTADAGYTFFTIDPSAFVANEADTMALDALASEVAGQESDSVYGGESVEALYLDKDIEISENFRFKFDREHLLRAAVKYGRAIHHVQEMSSHIAASCQARLYEIEVSVDETDPPTSSLEHLFFALELKRRGIVVVSLAPRFIGDFEKGIDYKGDLNDFERSLEEHIAIARAYGPYKLSMHSGSDKFSAYPVIGRVCQDLLHVKTAGTSYLEALRVVCRKDPDLFKEIACYSAGRFSEDKATYHLSTTDEDIGNLGGDATIDLEKTYLEENIGRQLLHVTFGSVLTAGKRESGQSFKSAIDEILRNNEALHLEVLETHFDKHLSLLNAG